MDAVRNNAFGPFLLKYSILAMVGIALIPSTCFCLDVPWKWIEGTKVQNMLKEGSGLWLIDVRGSNAYDIEHIEGSVNVPANYLQYKKFPLNKRLVLVDDSLGLKTAKEAVEMLVKNGYESVYILEGGLTFWRFEGHPVVGQRSLIRGVSADELRWAIQNEIPLTIYDMRGRQGLEKDRIQNSEPVLGNSINERVEKLKELLHKEESKDITNKLTKPRTIVLILSGPEDAAGLIERALYDTRDDIRYLTGGYEAYMSGKDKQVKAPGGCPTCPK